MKLVKYENPEATIFVKIVIDGIDLWHYSYQADEPFNNSNILGKKPVHELGIAKNLERDRHFWRITLGNATDNDKKVKVTIVWLEGEKPIATWIPGEAGQDGKVLVKANDGIEITDTALFTQA